MKNRETPPNFIKTVIEQDLQSGTVNKVVTRFPPEPNGYLHIGHAKAIWINFTLGAEFGGQTNLRFDDTNPLKEDTKYVKCIQEDVRWLGYMWDKMTFASDMFEQMYEKALLLIRKGKAYVDDQTADEIRNTRGTLTQPGQNSPYRNRDIAENVHLFERMRAGDFANGTKVLRAKIDMGSPNINMRDPVIYRIMHQAHHHAGQQWCIYPMYAFAHPLEDAMEGVTHSLCSLEFEDQRPFYNWVVLQCEMDHTPQQYEFGRLNVSGMLTSKRKLKLLVDQGYVDGWDDPRLPTLSGMRRRGYTPNAILNFVHETGISKSCGTVDVQTLEHFVREDLKMVTPRTMAILHPLKLIITNYTSAEIEWLEVENHPENLEMGKRKIPFSRELFIEREDFMETPPSKYFRLYPGGEVRLKHAYFVKCHDVKKDEQGNIIEVHCTYDPETKSGTGFQGRKVKGTIHWVEATCAVPSTFYLYDSLISEVADDEAIYEENASFESSDDAFLRTFNPRSLHVTNGFVEPHMKTVQPQLKVHFIRQGYFNVDPKHSAPGKPAFNRIVSLKSSFRL